MRKFISGLHRTQLGYPAGGVYGERMAISGTWLAIDVIGTKLETDVFVHSADGKRVARRLDRCASMLGFDKAGEKVVRAVARAKIAGEEVPTVPGLFIESHHIDAADGTAVGLILWVGEREPDERPTYNAWILDMAALTTRTSGDDPAMIGDGRETGETRHIQYLFTWLNPEDAWAMVGGYYDALTGDDGILLDSYWSLRPGGTEWVHMWSSTRLRVSASGARTLYGLTLRIKHREIEANIASLIRYTNATLLLVEARERFPITTIGARAPLGEERIKQVLDQINLDKLARVDSDEPVEQRLTIDGESFLAAPFELHSAQGKHADPVAIILLLEDQTAVRS